MNAAHAPYLEKYQYLNQYAAPGQILFFGSSYLDAFPLYELKEDYNLDQTIFKRTIPGLTIEETFDCLDTCVFDLNPSKLFISFGDEDLKSAHFSIAVFIAQYRKLLIELEKRLPKCEIFLLSSVFSKELPQLNQAIAELARDYHCEFISLGVITAVSDSFDNCPSSPTYADDFRHIKVFLHSNRLKLSEALNL